MKECRVGLDKRAAQIKTDVESHSAQSAKLIKMIAMCKKYNKIHHNDNYNW